MGSLNTEQLQAVNSNSDRILCLAGAGTGKALRNSTKVKTPMGDVAIEQLAPGDLVFASDGNAYRVLGVYPQGKKSVVRITFSDRNYIDCSEDHLWIYQTKSMRDHHKGFAVNTTKELSELPLQVPRGKYMANNLYIPMCKPCRYDHQDVPIDPYFLGLLLGDGGLSRDCVTFNNTEPDILSYVESVATAYDCHLQPYDTCTYGITANKHGRGYKNTLLEHIRALGLNCLSVDKHIPDIYKYNDIEIRFSVLQGLIDTDGYINKSMVEFSTASSQLASDVLELSESLGMTSVFISRDSHYIKNGDRVDLDHDNYRIFIKPSKQFSNLFRSKKHATQRLVGSNQNYARRHIASIEYLDIVDDMTCIAVDSPDHSFLTEHYIVTHNTKTMIERISRLVSDGVAPSSILALTFTNAAAAEMKSRYEKAHLGKETPEFRTFHSFCYSILCKDPNIRAALNYESVPQIASEAQERAIEERAKAQCHITISKEHLMHRESLTKKELFQADLYDKAVNRLMRSENLITFDKLNSEVSNLFASDHPATKLYKEQYKYICVDEFQDTDSIQIKFLNSFTDVHLYFCGDVLQNIYSFRGTSNEFIKLLASTPDWEKIKLFTNYRSTKQICEYANKFSAKYADASYKIEMRGTRDGERVVTKLIDGPSNYNAINPRDLDDVIKENAKLSGTTAILCRTNREVSFVTSYLKKQGVEYTTNRETNNQHLIECALSDTYMLGRLASYLSSDKYGEYLRLAAQVKNPNAEWFLSQYGSVPQIRADAKIISQLRIIAASSEPMDVKLGKVVDLLGLQSISKSSKNYTGRAFLEYLKDAVNDIKTSELYVGTIHSVKGLEYDNVFVMNVGSYSFKLNNEDEKNLFYVAVTRAKNRLYVYELFD